MQRHFSHLVYWLCLSCCALVCSSCVIITGGYPKSWAPAEHPVDDCKNELTGVYMMLGEDFENGYLFMKPLSTPTRLDKYLMRGLAVDADRIKIAGPSDGHLIITAEQGDTLVVQRTLIEHSDYECHRDGVSLKPKQDGAGYDKDLAAMAFFWKGERYSRAADGALIIRRTARGGGMMLYVPMIGASEDWSRFLPATPP